MVTGVIAFSFATGSLTGYIQQSDRKNEAFDEKMNQLDNIFKKYPLPKELYSQIK